MFGVTTNSTSGCFQKLCGRFVEFVPDNSIASVLSVNSPDCVLPPTAPTALSITDSLKLASLVPTLHRSIWLNALLFGFVTMVFSTTPKRQQRNSWERVVVLVANIPLEWPAQFWGVMPKSKKYWVGRTVTAARLPAAFSLTNFAMCSPVTNQFSGGVKIAPDCGLASTVLPEVFTDCGVAVC